MRFVGLVLVFACCGLLLAGTSIAAEFGPPNSERAFELVSGFDKNGGDVAEATVARSSALGDSVTFNAFSTQAQQSAVAYNQFLAHRTSDGWHTSGINPPLDAFPAVNTFPARYQAFTEDLSRSVANSWAFEGFPGATQMFNLFLRHPDGHFVLLSRPTAPIPGEMASFTTARTNFVAATPSFTRILFESHRPLTADAPAEAPGQDYLYLWENGGIRLVSYGPDGNPILGPVFAGGTGSVWSGRVVYPGQNVMSLDGSQVFFTTPILSGGGRLYRYTVGGGTRMVSASQRTDCADGLPCSGVPVPDPQGTQPAEFHAASADGSIAFFSSPERLTDDSTATPVRRDLYRWDAAGATNAALSDLTTQDTNGADVLGILGAADDGSRIYFVATGDVAPGSSPGAPNLYLWESGTGVQHIATLDGSIEPQSGEMADAGDWAVRRGPGSLHTPRYRDARVSEDGSHVLFSSQANITSYDARGFRQIYLYSRRADSITCVSCNPRTAHATGDVFLKRPFEVGGFRQMQLHRNLSRNGDRAFFDSPEALVPEDSNGSYDVYEWHASTVRLVSSGKANGGSAFLDASADGRDVFFTTRERLLQSDGDGVIDVYNARHNGGFAVPDLPSPCNSRDCAGGQGGPPTITGLPSTAALTGRGNFSTSAPNGNRVLRLSKRQRAALAQGGHGTLRVRTGSPGEMVCLGRPAGGPQSAIVVVGSKTVKRAGPASISLQLTNTGRRLLKARKSLRVRLSVRFPTFTGTRDSEIMLREASVRRGAKER